MTPDAPYNVLFLTWNLARSVLAESIMNCAQGDRFRAYSAGSDPRGEMWERAFLRAFHHLSNRISVFAALPVDKLKRTSLTAEIRAIGRLDDTTASAPKPAGSS